MPLDGGTDRCVTKEKMAQFVMCLLADTQEIISGKSAKPVKREDTVLLRLRKTGPKVRGDDDDDRDDDRSMPGLMARGERL